MMGTEKKRELKVVKFLRNVAPWNKGETAGFAPTRADSFIAEGWAEEVKGSGRKEPKSTNREAPTKTRRALGSKDTDVPEGQTYETK